MGAISEVAKITAIVIPLLVPIVSGVLLAQSTGKPQVYIDLKNSNNGRETAIMLTNNGSLPATNISLVVKAPKNILSVTNAFSTATVFFNGTLLRLNESVPVNESLLNIHVNKLVQGDGSIVTLSTSMQDDNSESIQDYIAFAAYDQGSITLGGHHPITYFGIIPTDWLSPAAILLITYVIFIPPYLYWYSRFFKARKVSKLLYNLIDVRNRWKKLPWQDIELQSGEADTGRNPNLGEIYYHQSDLIFKISKY